MGYDLIVGYAAISIQLSAAARADVLAAAAPAIPPLNTERLCARCACIWSELSARRIRLSPPPNPRLIEKLRLLLPPPAKTAGR